jgi:ribonuclease E
MSNNKMLIDATHPEETRVVVLRNNRVEEFDYESAARKLLRGNIYLAKVTRVEPSLQAAFVDYGGNRHGFLAFNEIHPDYYQIPMADRQALLDEEAAAEAREEAEADARAERLARRQRQRGEFCERGAEEASADESGSDQDAEQDERQNGDEAPYPADEDHAAEAASDQDSGADDEDGQETSSGTADDEPRTVALASSERDPSLAEDVPGSGLEPDEDLTPETGSGAEATAESETGDSSAEQGSGAGEVVQVVPPSNGEAEAIEQVGSEDALEELPSRPRRRPRSYKIQEVIKRRQIILVQVVKEERGTKGAALTTYLSLAGRYTVLMPNTARGGGISRKITNPQDRKRLKAIAAELEVPEGMGLIIRTAGAARTKQEIKRDFEYLLRLWESVRELTLQSTAPSLVYEEGNLIKRSIRDLYNKDVEEVIVAGSQAHEEARAFMRMLMPSHAKNVILHSDPEPLFTRFGIERQLNAMFSPYVTLRSGGYLVINQTEALVAVDVNSGKATREFSIEETALQTNLEAADEIARQLKLRDLAGLIVIDFIDMEEKRNNRAVERRLKDALRFDRARIQLGRISHFGLMEMSRQRLRSGVLEGSTSQCPHCQGTGIIRSTESVALAVLRGLEDALMQGARTSLVATTTAQVALYILNNKRQFINDMEANNGVSIVVQASDKLQGANFSIEKGHAAAQPQRRPERAAVNMDWGFEGDGETEAGAGIEDEAGEADYAEEAGRARAGREQQGYADEPEDDSRGGRRRKRRRGRRGGGVERQGGEHQGGERFGGEGRRQSYEGRRRGPQPAFEAPPDGFQSEDLGPQPDAGYADGDHRADLEAGAGEAGYTPQGEQSRGERDDERGGRRRRRGRRGGRRGRGRDRGPDGYGAEGAQSSPASHVTEEIIDDFGGAVMPDDSDAAGDQEIVGTEPASGRRSDRGARHDRRQREPRQAAGPDVATDASRKTRREPAEERHGAHRSETAESRPSENESPRQDAADSGEAGSKAERPRRSLSSSAEPRHERVVVGSEAAGIEDGAPAPAEPKRGWWQRRLGG